MALSVTLDYGLRELDESGYHHFFTSRAIDDEAGPVDSASARGLFADPATRTLMLCPLQLRSDWINTAAQLASIVRLSQMVTNAADVAAGRVFEANIQGNANNPFIFHSPVTTTALSPVSGYPDIASIAALEPLLQQPLSLVGTAPGTPADELTATGRRRPLGRVPSAASDGRFICATNGRLDANQALYIRWFHPDPRAGHQTAYAFLFGQYCLMIQGDLVETFRDNSAGGDRSAWVKVNSTPLFSPGSFDNTTNNQGVGRAFGSEPEPHHRALFILPFQQNRLLIMATMAKWVTFLTRPQARRLADNSDWDITRSDVLSVWALTPSPGHFQIQKILYKQGPVTLHLPPLVIDYTPAGTVTVALKADADHGASVAATITTPPGYTLPANDAEEEPAPTTDASGQSRTYGGTLTFNSSGDQRWTPFFYGIGIEAPRHFINAVTTPTTFNDTQATTTRVRRARIRNGMEPGDGVSWAELIDTNPFSLSPYYYRSSVALRISLNGTACFTGWTEPHEISPLRYLGAFRSVTLRAVDRWRQLVETTLRDQRDWTGFGHITVVRSVVEQAGIDTTLADTPPVGGSLDTPLGGLIVPPIQQQQNLNPGWKPKDRDTAASYVKRVADLFSGWMLGFHPSGEFFYQPRYKYTTPTLTFFESRASAIAAGQAAAPLVRNEEAPEFRTLEPEANVIQVIANRTADGNPIRSAVYVDWASLNNPAAVNYLGRRIFRPLFFGGVLTMAQLNIIARVVFDAARRRRRQITFKADYVPTLRIGEMFTVEGYGNYRLVRYDADLVHPGADFCSYTGELDELGYNP